MFLKRTTFVCVAIIGFVSMFLISCSDSTQRHKVLTFFFDGVPPLATEMTAGEMGPPRPGSVSAKAEEGAETQKKEVWYVHEPVTKDCNACHKRIEKGQWAVPEFTKKPPELCYDCHDNPAKAKGFVHGPVAAGECLFCHTPHRSPNKYLLKEKDPELCYKCHQKFFIESIPQHNAKIESIPQYPAKVDETDAAVLMGLVDADSREIPIKKKLTECLSCHEGHAGSTISLLKPDWNKETK